MKAYQAIVVDIVRTRRPRSLLDLPSGLGWLPAQTSMLGVEIDGIDLYEDQPKGYRNFLKGDLDEGVPAELGCYDMIVSCEGIEHIANPGLFLKSARKHLSPGGTVVVTTPNTWHAAARVKYFLRGFFPGFPSLAGKIEAGTHMHIMPWSWSHLYLHLALAGFTDIELHPCIEDDRVHFYEKLLAIPMRSYCRRHAREAKSAEVREYWITAAEPASLYSRRLVVSARNPG